VDQSAFDHPIHAGASAEEADRLLEARLDVQVPSVRTLADQVLGDLDAQLHGIGWWAPHLDDKRRIFLSDYLVQLMWSFPQNLVEAALHLFEVETNHERVCDQIKHAVGPDLKVRMAPKTSLRELLPGRLVDLHAAGVFRALGSALDTLAGIVVAVGAFEQKIITMDFDKLFKKAIPTSPGGQLQGRIKTVVEDSVRAAGPPGWLGWTTEYRNMLVHRGRRLQLGSLVPDAGPSVLNASGTPILRARGIMHLARDPNNSDLQAFFGATSQPSRLSNVLEEDGVRSLGSALEAVVFVARRVSDVLLEVWQARRTAPNLLLQPRSQWPDLSIHPDAFAGFTPGSVPVAPTSLTASPNMVLRLRAAAVESSLRAKWLGFTGQ
jgi:hypothetical protein